MDCRVSRLRNLGAEVHDQTDTERFIEMKTATMTRTRVVSRRAAGR